MERISMALTAEQAASIKAAVGSGAYASTSEVIRDALRTWEQVRALRADELANLRSDIAKGMADVAAGRVSEYNADAVIEEIRRRSAASSRSA